MEIATQMMEEGRTPDDVKAANNVVEINGTVETLHALYRQGAITKDQTDAAVALNTRLVREYQEVEDLYRSVFDGYKPEDVPMIAGNKNDIDVILDRLWMDFQGIHAHVLIQHGYIKSAGEYVDALD